MTAVIRLDRASASSTLNRTVTDPGTECPRIGLLVIRGAISPNCGATAVVPERNGCVSILTC